MFSAVDQDLQRLTKNAEIVKTRIFTLMHSLIFLVVELETARTTLLNVFEAANGTPKWTWHPTLPEWAVPKKSDKGSERDRKTPRSRSRSLGGYDKGQSPPLA
jgi:hypothetical protein